MTPRRRGRPLAAERRTESITIRLTPREARAVAAVAARDGRRPVGQKVRVILVSDPEVVAELAKTAPPPEKSAPES